MCETDFADDNIHYVSGGSIDDVIKSLEDDSINLFWSFLDNRKKAVSNKCLLITSKQSCMNLKIENINIENSTREKLLGVKIDNTLNFKEHLSGIIKKASRKFNAFLEFSLSWTQRKGTF